MKKLGKKQLTLHLPEPLAAIPADLSAWALTLNNDGSDLEYVFDANQEQTAIRHCCNASASWDRL